MTEHLRRCEFEDDGDVDSGHGFAHVKESGAVTVYYGPTNWDEAEAQTEMEAFALVNSLSIGEPAQCAYTPPASRYPGEANYFFDFGANDSPFVE